jgi:hypothetical protein
MKNITFHKKESLNKIKIIKGINRSVNKNNKREISPISYNTNSSRNRNFINKKNDIKSNKNLIINCRNGCLNNISKKNIDPLYNTFVSNNKKKGIYEGKDIKINGRLNTSNNNNKLLNLLDNKYFKGRNSLNAQLNKSYNLFFQNKKNKNKIKKKIFRLSPNTHANEFLKKFFNNRIIPCKSNKIIANIKAKSPNSYVKTSKINYNKEKNKNNNTINSNKSLIERNGSNKTKKQNKIINIYKKNI